MAPITQPAFSINLDVLTNHNVYRSVGYFKTPSLIMLLQRGFVTERKVCGEIAGLIKRQHVLDCADGSDEPSTCGWLH